VLLKEAAAIIMSKALGYQQLAVGSYAKHEQAK
jgi:hypothetical protein